jgi:hypothetical protein
MTQRIIDYCKSTDHPCGDDIVDILIRAGWERNQTTEDTMKRFTFSYRDGEITALVEANSQEEAKRKLANDDPRIEYEVHPDQLHPGMWEWVEE